MNTLGLNVFIAIVGISAGPGFVCGLQQVGVSLFLWGMVATSVPLIIAVLLGHYVFKFHPAILFGVCAGVRTTTAALGMIQDAAKSKIPRSGLWHAVRDRQHAAHDLRHGDRAAAHLTLTGRRTRPRSSQMDIVKLREYEALSPFEIKDFLAKAATSTAQASAVAYLNAGRGNPNWIATEPREAFFLLGQFAITESKRVLDLPPGVGGMPQARGIAGRLAGLAARSTRTRRAPNSWPRSCRGPCSAFGFDAGQVRARARRFDHRRQLPGARSHARAQRADRARVPAVGDVRAAAAEGTLQPVRRRRRHGGDVLHLQVA